MVHELYNVGTDADPKAPMVDDDLVNCESQEAVDLFIADSALSRACAHLTKDGPLPDRVFTVGAEWLLVSGKAKEAITSDLGVCPSIRWVPTEMTYRGGRLCEYQLAYGAALHDVWNYRESEFFWHPGKEKGTKEAAGYLIRGVVDPTKVPGFDLFLAERGWWIGSGKFKSVIERANMTGFTFESVTL